MHIVIIGNGISGITAAREIRKKSDHEITVISSETDHFYSRTALMYIYMGHMNYEHTKPYEDFFWKKNRINLVKNRVERVDFEQKILYYPDESILKYDKLILATGSSSNKFGWPGQDANRVLGLYNFQDLEALEEISPEIETAVIVGGGLIGIELAEMLRSRNKKVIFLVRDDGFWGSVLPKEDSKLISDHIAEHHIDLRLNSELQEILTDSAGNAIGVKTKNNEVIDCQFVGLTVGVHPNIGFVKNSALETDRGILVNEYLETNLKDVYAIGDCVQHKTPPIGRKALEQIWYTGKIMGETLAQNICGTKQKYEPGVFFNSAKFLDIEYQTYGFVPAETPENMHSFVWQHPSEKKLVRINFDKKTEAVKGVNTFGIRMRHEIWEAWLQSEAKIDTVLSDLKQANFDPEFFKRHESEIIDSFNQQFGKSILLLKRKWSLASLFN